MDKTYQPAAIESNIYQTWLKRDAFKTKTSGQPFCIMLPPPNVTGSLHMGHAFQQTLMDILIRSHRMMGERTLWQIGMDHAGIATQMAVENQLFKEGKTRYDLGREKFVKRVWQWKEESGGTIMKQMKRVGAAADWSRERFTMDEGMDHAVQTAFIKLYEEGLIYRGKRLVNWDPHFKTAVSDLEVVHSEEQGLLYHISYPIVGSNETLIIATTRPETLLGDMAVAVHPEDERYRHLIGKKVALPLCAREIPIIADEYVDKEFGTGCVKITPAHDFNDYEVGKRHKLDLFCILTLDGKINDQAPSAYQDLDRFAARKQILKDLEAQGLLVDKKPHTLNVPRNERGNTVLEPMLTDQWYVKMAPLAKPAVEAVKTGQIQFVPEEWQNTYFRWLENIQDWCISRQLWWGHRIPAWYDDKTGQIYVGTDEAQIRQKHHLAASVTLRQDEDVLDTWFSSALWPFSTLGWPEQTPELAAFYPTSVLVTGFDIIFFWVARMIMFGLHFTQKVPFKAVYIHGLIRDHEGQKMSKTKGNGLDPVDLIDGVDLQTLIAKRTAGLMQDSLKPKVIKATEKEFPEGIQAFGTDALRFTFAAIASPTRDINFSVKRLEGYRNFCNKLWNATRFVMMNLSESSPTPMMDQGQVIQAERGDLSANENIHNYFDFRLNQTIDSVHQALASYRFDLMAQTLYDFFWNDYCDWYLEFCKVMLNAHSISPEEKAHTGRALLVMLEKILRLLHPIIPFITEEIWQTLKAPLELSEESILDRSYPQSSHFKQDASWQFTPWLQELITKIRTIRSERNIHPTKTLPLYVDGTPDFAPELFMGYLKAMAKVEAFLPMQKEHFATAQSLTLKDKQYYLGDVVDREAEKARIQKELSQLEADQQKIAAKLSNAEFIKKAPPAVVEKEQQRLTDLQTERALLLKGLQG